MSARRRPYFESQRAALILGVGALAFGAFCLRDAYERRGRSRPPLVSWLGI